MSEEPSEVVEQDTIPSRKISLGVVVTVGLFILSLTLFLSPLLSYMVVILTAIAVIVKAPSGKTLRYVFLSVLSMALAIISAVLSVVALLLPANGLFLVSMLLGFPSPIPLLIPVLDMLGIDRETRAALAVALLAAGITTLPLYGTAPLHLQGSLSSSSMSNVVNSVGFLGLYVAVGYAPSSLAIIAGYLILIYVVMNGLKAYLQRTT